MVRPNRRSQKEHNKILDEHSARTTNLSQTECEVILIRRGVSSGQAKDGAYVYIHHNGNVNIGRSRLGTQGEYTEILDDFEAFQKTPQECIVYLKSLGFRYGQSKSAVYNYRCNKGLIRK